MEQHARTDGGAGRGRGPPAAPNTETEEASGRQQGLDGDGANPRVRRRQQEFPRRRQRGKKEQKEEEKYPRTAGQRPRRSMCLTGEQNNSNELSDSTEDSPRPLPDPKQQPGNTEHQAGGVPTHPPAQIAFRLQKAKDQTADARDGRARPGRSRMKPPRPPPEAPQQGGSGARDSGVEREKPTLLHPPELSSRSEAETPSQTKPLPPVDLP